MADFNSVIKQLEKNQEKNTNQLASLNDQVSGLNNTMNQNIKIPFVDLYPQYEELKSEIDFKIRSGNKK